MSARGEYVVIVEYSSGSSGGGGGGIDCPNCDCNCPSCDCNCPNCNCRGSECITFLSTIVGIAAFFAIFVFPIADMSFTINSAKPGAHEGSMTYMPTGTRIMSTYDVHCAAPRESYIKTDLLHVGYKGKFAQLYGGPSTFCNLNSSFDEDSATLCEVARATQRNGIIKIVATSVFLATAAVVAIVYVIISVCRGDEFESVRAFARFLYLSIFIGVVSAITEIVAIGCQRSAIFSAQFETECAPARSESSIYNFMFAAGFLEVAMLIIAFIVLFKMRSDDEEYERNNRWE